jgi:hypothetical protein
MTMPSPAYVGAHRARRVLGRPARRNGWRCRGRGESPVPVAQAAPAADGARAADEGSPALFAANPYPGRPVHSRGPKTEVVHRGTCDPGQRRRQDLPARHRRGRRRRPPQPRHRPGRVRRRRRPVGQRQDHPAEPAGRHRPAHRRHGPCGRCGSRLLIGVRAGRLARPERRAGVPVLPAAAHPDRGRERAAADGLRQADPGRAAPRPRPAAIGPGRRRRPGEQAAGHAAVLVLFAGLHAEGRTIVVVTHERDIRSVVGREVTLVDGRVVTDERAPQGVGA